MKKLFTHFGMILLFASSFFPEILKAGNGQMMFVAIMSCGDEVPPIIGDGQGLVTILFSEDRKEAFVHGIFTDLTGPVTGCHIHLGSTEDSGPVVVDLSALVSGNTIKGKLPIQADLIFAAAVDYNLYINVHTAANPDGEIRGQLTWMSEVILPVLAQGSNEIPPVSTTGVGLGALRFSQNLTRMEYQIKPTGLSGPVTAAHLHYGLSSMNGAVAAPLNTGEFITGFIDDPTLVGDLFYAAYTDSLYLNVHTAAHPDGEIRGQVVIDNPNNATALLNGDQETPPVTTTAQGFGYAALDFPKLDSISYILVSSGIVPTAAHIHKSTAGVAGAVIIPLSATAFPGIYFGKTAISSDNVTSFMKDDLYFNIHSSAHPAGEIRGQFESNLLKSYAFDLCGDQEAPKKTVKGYGAGFVAVNKSNTELIYGLAVNDLTNTATAAHIHDGAFGSSGPVILALEKPQPLYVDYLPITGTVGGKIDLDGAYMNVHTSTNPAGEIRGQIRRQLSCAINVATVESAIHDLSLKSNLISDEIILNTSVDKNALATVYVSDISGKQLVQWPKTKFIPGISETSFQVEFLSSGFYLLNIVDENNSVRSLKFVKQ
jgi:hypothetical protein